MWSQLPILIAQLRCQREHRQRHGHELLKRSGERRIAQHHVALEPAHHRINGGRMQLLRTPYLPERGDDLDLGHNCDR